MSRTWHRSDLLLGNERRGDKVSGSDKEIRELCCGRMNGERERERYEAGVGKVEEEIGDGVGGGKLW